ncbi:DUF4369 domain-containing protein [Ancylomarina euxinus]|uniref:DUF4369 domain-containing protein n=1 Tax=Ancylomarina euxinus TaxID=2283627 RepID=A0A425XY58_9BACT|nr:DUF4369 domain-containing protein [Ancylomarina euxinus]MCZ4695957.1 DUF4369 domain-containing protein [Ancylomarina euxinus]MUP16329.1 DUF4369 domain-containing protein [Ancylomarina euxinus]RRG19725.1 DUF4369 domain-containing protein [Ancylomarina euxinus]
MKNLKQALAFMLILSTFFACNEAKVAKTTFVMNGTLEGITDGKIMLSTFSEEGSTQDSALIKEGKFIFKGDFSSPRQAYLQIEGTRAFKMIYVENEVMTLNGNVEEFGKASITGSQAQDGLNIYDAEKMLIEEKYKDVIPEFYKPGITEERKAELEKEIEKQMVEMEALNEKFIKENPATFHSVVLVSQKLSGKSAVDAEKTLNALAPELQKNPLIVKLKAKFAKMKEVEKGFDEVMANASNVAYKVDSKFKGESLKDIIYLGAFLNNNICALQKDGTVQIIDPMGKLVSNFKPELKGAPASIAVDQANQIYVLSTLQKKVTKKVRGKSYDRMVPMGVECTILNEKGEQVNQYSLPSLKTATGARISDDILIIADYQNKRIAMFDAKTGNAGASIDEMRPCCGILDFSVNAKKEILVANLGAFRVQGFDFKGKNIVAFGQRGKSLDEFHGCCNPVSVNSLSNGAIVTVEKDPTRIKIYSKEGAKQIAGIEELVKGCSHIPMIVDAKDNLYLASGAKGVVKCVSIN